MNPIGRRAFGGAVGLLPLLLAGRAAHATLLRGLSLRDMTLRSAHVLLLTPFESHSSYATIGRRRLIVTETQARVEEVMARSNPGTGEITVHTLGGIVEGMGQLVQGQAELALNSLCAAFLTRGEDGTLWVTGMAQGHYPITGGATARQYLNSSPNLPAMVDYEHSAVKSLVGRELSEARRLVVEASAP